MTKLTSRFLVVVMLAALALSGVTTTSAFCAGLLRAIRPAPHIEHTFPVPERFPPRNHDGIGSLDRPDLSNEACDFACQDNPPRRPPPSIDGL